MESLKTAEGVFTWECLMLKSEHKGLISCCQQKGQCNWATCQFLRFQLIQNPFSTPEPAHKQAWTFYFLLCALLNSFACTWKGRTITHVCLQPPPAWLREAYWNHVLKPCAPMQLLLILCTSSPQLGPPQRLLRLFSLPTRVCLPICFPASRSGVSTRSP